MTETLIRPDTVPQSYPDEHGRFGRFGGQYAPETLMPALEELEQAWKDAQADSHDVQSFRWQGEDEIGVPGWGGALHFTPVVDEEGFDPAWLREAVLEVRPRGGGERFKPHPARPSKTLKRLFQDAGIPEFERGRLPLVWRKGELIYVAGLGADVRMTDRDGERIVVQWQPDAGLIDRNP